MRRCQAACETLPDLSRRTPSGNLCVSERRRANLTRLPDFQGS